MIDLYPKGRYFTRDEVGFYDRNRENAKPRNALRSLLVTSDRGSLIRTAYFPSGSVATSMWLGERTTLRFEGEAGGTLSGVVLVLAEAAVVPTEMVSETRTFRGSGVPSVPSTGDSRYVPSEDFMTPRDLNEKVLECQQNRDSAKPTASADCTFADSA